MIEVTIVYDNTVYRENVGLQADWGFACVVRGEGIPTVLFDTGARGDILLSNMERLSIAPDEIDMVFISHNHLDHTGGLGAFVAKNRRVKIYVLPSFGGLMYSEVTLEVVRTPIEIVDGIFSTGELEGIEQSMVVATREGAIVFVGCSHPGMKAILSSASQFGIPYAVIGGFHGFREYQLFRDLSLICPCHCTVHKAEIKRLYPKKCVDGGVGRVIEI